MALISASSALGASAVTCTMPVNAGLPLAGRAGGAPGVRCHRASCAGRCRWWRRRFARARRCAACAPSNGLSHSDRARRSRGAADSRSPAQLIAKLGWVASSLAEHVREQALGEAAAVQRQPRRARDGARREVHFELAPALRRRRRSPAGGPARARAPSASASGAGADRARSPRARAPAAASRPPARRSADPASRTACARRAISGRTGTVSRGSRFSCESSLSGRKREKRACQPAACAAQRGGLARGARAPAPVTSAPQREPKQSNSSIASRALAALRALLMIAMWSPRRRQHSILHFRRNSTRWSLRCSSRMC